MHVLTPTLSDVLDVIFSTLKLKPEEEGLSGGLGDTLRILAQRRRFLAMEMRGGPFQPWCFALSLLHRPPNRSGA